MTISVHYQTERQKREQIIKEKIGYGKIVKHIINSEENIIYAISSTGIINVINHQNYLLITRKIARPAQLIRFYSIHNEIVPNYLLQIAKKHQRLGYNRV